jgi:ATP-binding cassette subfamily F protein 3
VGFVREEKAHMNPSAAVWTPAAAAAALAVESDGSEQGAAVARICSQVLQGLDDDTLEYVATSCVDDGRLLPKSELVEFVAPLLLDAEVCEDEDAAVALAETLWDALCAGPATDGTGEAAGKAGLVAAAEDSEPKLLEKRVIVAVGKAAQDARIAQGMAAMMDLAANAGCVNPIIKVWNLDEPGGEAELTDKQLRELLKKRKKDEKRFAKDTRLEKASAERRNALIQALRTRPVVLHRDVSCATIPDINLVGVSMDLDSKILLEDVTCSIVAGRRYGLIGKNGTGKTTFLRHLAAKAFVGVEALKELQVVHIEQEIDGDERSVLATVRDLLNNSAVT